MIFFLCLYTYSTHLVSSDSDNAYSLNNTYSLSNQFNTSHVTISNPHTEQTILDKEQTSYNNFDTKKILLRKTSYISTEKNMIFKDENSAFFIINNKGIPVHYNQNEVVMDRKHSLLSLTSNSNCSSKQSLETELSASESEEASKESLEDILKIKKNSKHKVLKKYKFIKKSNKKLAILTSLYKSSQKKQTTCT